MSLLKSLYMKAGMMIWRRNEDFDKMDLDAFTRDFRCKQKDCDFEKTTSEFYKWHVVSWRWRPKRQVNPRLKTQHPCNQRAEFRASRNLTNNLTQFSQAITRMKSKTMEHDPSKYMTNEWRKRAGNILRTAPTLEKKWESNFGRSTGATGELALRTYLIKIRKLPRKQTLYI